MLAEAGHLSAARQTDLRSADRRVQVAYLVSVYLGSLKSFACREKQGGQSGKLLAEMTLIHQITLRHNLAEFG